MGVLNHYEKISNSFRGMGQKKKLSDRPSIPSHPSHHPSVQVGWTPGTPWLEIRRLEHSTCKTRHSTCKTRHSTCKTRHSTCKTRHSTCEASHSTCKSSTVRARLVTARARLGYTLKGKKIPYKFVPPHL